MPVSNNPRSAKNYPFQFPNFEAVGFDLGETLIYYRGVPMSWAGLYRDALISVALKCNYAADKAALERGEAIVREYNTRLHPRMQEVSSDEILGRVLAAWGLDPPRYLERAAIQFFHFFRQEPVAYVDSLPTLQRLASSGIQIGILTDVMYGMPRNFVLEDIAKAGIDGSQIKSLLTSLDVGQRKPNPRGFLQLAAEMSCPPERMLFVGNEFNDIAGAGKAGMTPILIDRAREKPDWGQAWRIESLDELAGLFEFETH